jgi:hypothetical protein
MDMKQVLTSIANGQGRKLGLLGGLIMGLIFLFFGFWRMVFFAAIVGFGYLVGKQTEQGEGIKQRFAPFSLDRFLRK